MGNELQVIEGSHIARQADVMPVRDLLEMQAKIKQIMDEVMKEGAHYGNIPGCPKPSLYQPGAEKLLETFRLAAQHDVHDLSTPGIVRYRVRCEIVSIITGAVLGDEWGECSSDEEKYAWKSAVCHEEWDETPVDQRRKKWMKGSDRKPFAKEQIRTNAADSANTILAMACKRAKVRAARAALAASDIFDVNVEDIPADIREEIFGDDTPKPKKSDALNRHQNPGHQAPTVKSGDPGAYKITFGKNAGRSLAELGEKSVQWYAENANNDDCKAACRAYLASLQTTNMADTSVEDTQTATQPPLPDVDDPFADQ